MNAAQIPAQINVTTPVGPMVVKEIDGQIVSIRWGETRVEQDTPVLAAAAQQLNAYFYCGLREFDLKLAPAGSEFEQAVWQEMLRIPFGATKTYGEIARAVGGMPQAVGGACGSNPIPIVIPCHRVLAGGGRIGGYSGRGGAETKTFLLTLEGALLV
jgi:methylated-DNA-[protein]-cysteine S-methyltransferase